MKEKPQKQEIIFGDFESAQDIALKLIPIHHPELASADFKFICRSKSTKKAGKPVPGNVYKLAGKFKHLVGADFIMEIALDCWNYLEPFQRNALVDHLLSRCVGVENEKTGDMQWSLRPPEVQEFPEIAERHGQWCDGLIEMARVLEHK